MKLFEKNVGTVDRIVRVILGIVLILVSALYMATPLLYLGALIGVILIGRGVFGTCGIYSLLGINTATGNKK